MISGKNDLLIQLSRFTLKITVKMHILIYIVSKFELPTYGKENKHIFLLIPMDTVLLDLDLDIQYYFQRRFTVYSFQNGIAALIIEAEK